MKPMKKQVLILSLVPSLWLCQSAAAAESSTAKPTEKPAESVKLPDLFRSNLTNYVKRMGRLKTQVTVNTDYQELRTRILKEKDAFDILDDAWPAGFSLNAQKLFAEAHVYYSLAARLYQYKAEQKDEPMPPNINDWDLFHKHGGDTLVLKTHPGDSSIEKQRGKEYMPFDENIAIFLKLAGERFESGRAIVYRHLEKK
ncbi:MAG: hypothetical protein WCO60_13030 [Verrucomicrobiota bacterium]